MIIHIKYVEPAGTKGLTVHDCGGPWEGTHVSMQKQRSFWLLLQKLRSA